MKICYDCNHCEVCKWIDEFKDKDVCDFYVTAEQEYDIEEGFDAVLDTQFSRSKPIKSLITAEVRDGMADIELVIKIDEEKYKRLLDKKQRYVGMGKYELTIANGTPLPKGHGRLIILSEDAVKREQISFSCQEWISEVGLSNATVTIIEADKESEG